MQWPSVLTNSGHSAMLVILLPAAWHLASHHDLPRWVCHAAPLKAGNLLEHMYSTSVVHPGGMALMALDYQGGCAILLAVLFLIPCISLSVSICWERRVCWSRVVGYRGARSNGVAMATDTRCLDPTASRWLPRQRKQWVVVVTTLFRLCEIK